MKRITLANYRSDRYYARMAAAVAEILKRSGFVAPVEVFVEMKLLPRAHIEDWRRCRIQVLERVIQCGLGAVNRILRVLQLHARQMGLSPSMTAYCRWGRGPKTRLRFSKSGDPRLEQAYSCHYVSAKNRKAARGGGSGPPGEAKLEHPSRVRRKLDAWQAENEMTALFGPDWGLEPGEDLETDSLILDSDDDADLPF